MSDPAAKPPRNLAEEIGKKKPFDLPEEEAYLNIIRTAEHLSRQAHDLLARHGLSEATYNVLRIVAARGEDGVKSQTIADDMVTRDPDVTRLIDRLEKLKMVRRRRCENDRRVIWIHVTPPGSSTLRKLHEPIRALLRKLLGHLGGRKLNNLSTLLFEARHPRPADPSGDGG